MLKECCFTRDLKAHEEITLTENGKAIAKVVPILPPKTSSFIGYMQGSIVVHGDIIEPVGDRWEASES